MRSFKTVLLFLVTGKAIRGVDGRLPLGVPWQNNGGQFVRSGEALYIIAHQHAVPIARCRPRLVTVQRHTRGICCAAIRQEDAFQTGSLRRHLALFAFDAA